MTIEQQTFAALPPYPEVIRLEFLRLLLPYETTSIRKALVRMRWHGFAERCAARCYRRAKDASLPDDRRGGRRPGAGRKRKA